ncbi:MAG: hypothetical protein ABF778_06850 [Liquorilactobacillus hordei]|uniref:hypothetical protein n=1 Tax=Liquorilactobacillus hordei TaxID=468911 RepID=UPI0039E7D2FC
MIDENKLMRAAKKLGLQLEFDSLRPGFYFRDSKKVVSFSEVGNFFIKKNDVSNQWGNSVYMKEKFNTVYEQNNFDNRYTGGFVSFKSKKTHQNFDDLAGYTEIWRSYSIEGTESDSDSDNQNIEYEDVYSSVGVHYG